MLGHQYVYDQLLPRAGQAERATSWPFTFGAPARKKLTQTPFYDLS